MIEKKINPKLINLALVAFIIGMLYLTSPFWGDIVRKLFSILAPFIISFAIAYALYPLLKRMMNKGIPKVGGIIIIVIAFLITVGLIVYTMAPIIYDQTISLINVSILTITRLSVEYNIDLSFLQSRLSDIGSLTKEFGGDISNFVINFITKASSFIILFFICFIVTLYLLSEMDNIREWIKTILQKNKKRFEYVKELDKQITNYFKGLQLIILIEFFEYTIVYMLIGHPYFLLMGILASVTTVIPYFGGIFANIVAIITAALISPQLLIMTLIVTFILPTVDGYIISPKVYSKSNQMHPIIIIFAVFAGGIIGGFWGIVVALPVAIILVYTYRFYNKEIFKKMKNK